VQSFDDFLVKVYLIADLLKTQVKGKYVAIMLPSLSVTALLICACYFAEKIPVMLNRTQSEVAFDACFHNQPLSTIFTVKSFYQKLQNPWLEKYPFTFFEDLLKKVGLFAKIKALLKSKFFSLPKKLDKMAVILFTSGSESLPKAVPLTHQNLLQDLS
jgi:long-chain-fatty-acid--[acyl-carrier-protein] ligase